MKVLLALLAVLVLAVGAAIVGCSSTKPTSSTDSGTFNTEQVGRVHEDAVATTAPPAPGTQEEEVWVLQREPEQLKQMQPAATGRSDPSTTLSVRGTDITQYNQRPFQRMAGDGNITRQTGLRLEEQAQESQQMGQQVREPEIPGGGSLVARLPDKMVPIPLKHTDVNASIAGYIATVDVRQQYTNPYSEKIEAVYVFPLPTNAAVNEFIMTIGDRKIRGIIREKEEAQRVYEEAKRQGYVASLLTQQRPNVFTQSIANIEPKKQIDVDIKYFHTLEYVDGWYEYVFPMVVGPRFNPPGHADGVGIKARGSAPGSTGQSAEVSYLKPDERSGHDISLSLDIDAGVKVEEVKSVNHQIETKREGETRTHVTLASSDSIPNKDFVLRYKVAGKMVKSALMAQRDERSQTGGGYFTLMLFPPESLVNLPRKPLEMVFTLDVSGSMSGKPIEQAKTAVRYALRHMKANDTFNVIRFANAAEQMAPRAVPVDDAWLKRADEYIEHMDAGGGTMMIDGIRKSLEVTPDDARLRFVTFLTDGYIGNEPEILAAIHNLRGPSRIFSFGVGTSVNHYLLDHMARMGQGVATCLSLSDDAEKVMADHFERLSHPALTDLQIDWGGMQVSEVYPAKLPDLFVGRPVIITGRYTGNANAATVRVHGKVGGEEREMIVKVNADDAANQHKGIAPVWARAKIADIDDRATYDSSADFAREIRQVALEYGLMSAYTSFVAVDSSKRTAGDHGTSVEVPVPVPAGVKYETTVPEK